MTKGVLAPTPKINCVDASNGNFGNVRVSLCLSGVSQESLEALKGNFKGLEYGHPWIEY